MKPTSGAKSSPWNRPRAFMVLSGATNGANRQPHFDPLVAATLTNGVNPMAYLADVLEQVVSGRTKLNELHTLLPWNWTASTSAAITSQAA
jgi:hypothetical protein